MHTDIRQGHEIFWQTIGTGPRPALAVHCTLGASQLWGPVLAPLGEQISATAFDQPNHGQSAPWDASGAAPGAFQTLVTQIAASFIDRPVDLIGHSFGASVALRIAVAAPEAVRSLTLIEPVLFAAVEGSEKWRELRAHQANFEDPGRICRPDGIEAIDAPVMLIHGDKSPAIGPEVCEAIAARLSDVGTACIPGGGHMLPVTHAQQVTDLIGLNLERS
jgi:pimeloyl-ACP methyl ester carboxylesterase